MPNTKLFTSEVIEGVNPGHSFQDLSHSVIMDMTYGKLIPSLVLECIPGDKIQIANQTEIKFQPLHTPAFTRMYVSNHYFFSPLRHLDVNWEDFYTTGEDGNYRGALETVDLEHSTTLQFTTKHDLKAETSGLNVSRIAALHTNWDFFGLPVLSGRGTTLDAAAGNARDITRTYLQSLHDADLSPLIYPWKAIMHIWDEYYRDEDLYERVWDYRKCQPRDGFALPLNPLPRAWMKDYFTSARPWRQKGTAPRVPVTGTFRTIDSTLQMRINDTDPPIYTDVSFYLTAGARALNTPELITPSQLSTRRAPVVLGSEFDASGLSFDMYDLRFVAQMQKYLELNARAGNRYTEYLRAQYGAFPSDARLNRPEYVGGTKEWVNISEVLQTSSSTQDSPQANRAGTANMFSRQFAVDYHVEEPGYIICLTSVMVEPFYQNQINRMWTRRSVFDFYIPLFANMSEQPVFNYEVATFDEPDLVFGYQGHANEYRTIDNRICGALRSYQGKYTQVGSVDCFNVFDEDKAKQSLDFWHTARKFSEQPKLNSEFIECNPRTDMFSVDPSLEWPMIGCVTHKIGAIRPMPSYSNPGRLDHMR